MSIIDTLITDRGPADLARYRELLALGPRMTDAERQELISSKAGYTEQDLNRVIEATAYIKDQIEALGYIVEGYRPISIRRPDIVIDHGVRPVTKPMTEATVSEAFTVTNGSYFFAPSASVPGEWANNNQNVDGSSATTTFTAKQDLQISFAYSVASEQGYDKLTIKVAGTTIANAISGTPADGSYTGALATGQTIELLYKKDGSGSRNGDTGKIYRFKATYDFHDVEIRPDPRPINRFFVDDIPTESQMAIYLGNLEAVRRVFDTAAALPQSMSRLTAEKANEIEKLLKNIDAALSRIALSFWGCGEIGCGEV